MQGLREYGASGLRSCRTAGARNSTAFTTQRRRKQVPAGGASPGGGSKSRRREQVRSDRASPVGGRRRFSIRREAGVSTPAKYMQNKPGFIPGETIPFKRSPLLNAKPRRIRDHQAQADFRVVIQGANIRAQGLMGQPRLANSAATSCRASKIRVFHLFL
jgi:hypothetical protein